MTEGRTVYRSACAGEVRNETKPDAGSSRHFTASSSTRTRPTQKTGIESQRIDQIIASLSSSEPGRTAPRESGIAVKRITTRLVPINSSVTGSLSASSVVTGTKLTYDSPSLP